MSEAQPTIASFGNDGGFRWRSTHPTTAIINMQGG